MGTTQYAIVTHGKIKSFEQLGHTKGHNDRSAKALPDNVIPDSPAPVTLVGEEGVSLVEVAKAKLRSHGIDPAHLRKNGVLANEDIYSASPAFFGEPDEWRARTPDDWRRHPWTVATTAFLKKKHGDNLISAVLHLDETTPHIHAVTLPLVEKARAKRGRMSKAERALPPSQRTPRPTVTRVQLDCRSLRGQEKWQLEGFVTEYANAVRHLGLERGRMISMLTKEERNARAEKASPTINVAKATLEADAERVRMRELAARASAEEAASRRRELEAEQLLADRRRARDDAERDRRLAAIRQREEALAAQIAETQRASEAAEQRLREAKQREAKIAEREKDAAIRDQGLSEWDDYLSKQADELTAETAKLATERMWLEKAKAELLRQFKAGMALLRDFFFARGMTAEVDALEGRAPSPGSALQAKVDPSAVALAEHHAALRRLSGEDL